MNKNFKDITGNKYGKLTVLGLDHKRGRNFYWRCKCDCGNETVVVGGAIKSGHTKSCGCAHKKAKLKDLVGERFGKLVVIEYSHKKNNLHYWKCKCDCGNEKIAGGKSLKSGNTKSCGCIPRKRFNVKNQKYDLSGTRIGRLTVVKRVIRSAWLCKCDCGNETIVIGSRFDKRIYKKLWLYITKSAWLNR